MSETLTLEGVNSEVLSLKNRVSDLENTLKPIPVETSSETAVSSNATASSASTQGGFFGGEADGGYAPLETTTKLYTGPVLGGRRTRRHKKKRHSYSRKSTKGLKNKLKRLFGFKGGNSKPHSSGGSTTVKSQH